MADLAEQLVFFREAKDHLRELIVFLDHLVHLIASSGALAHPRWHPQDESGHEGRQRDQEAAW